MNTTHILLDKLVHADDIVMAFTVNNLFACMGCFTCILKDEQKCPHRELTKPIIDAIDIADVIFFDSLNYCTGMSGQLKTFFDHLGYRWLISPP